MKTNPLNKTFMEKEQKKCSVCGEPAEYMVETAEWDEEDKEYTAHYNLVYVCAKHFQN